MSSVISAMPQLSPASASAGRISPVVATAMLDGISDFALWQKSGITTGGAARPAPSVPWLRQSSMPWSAGAASLSNTVNWRSPWSRDPLRTAMSISFSSSGISFPSSGQTGERLAHPVHVRIGKPRVHGQGEQLREDPVRHRQLAARFQAQEVAEVRQVMNGYEVHGGADASLGHPVGHRVPVHAESPVLDPHGVQVPCVRVRYGTWRKREAADAAQLRVVTRRDGCPPLLPGPEVVQLFSADGRLQVGEV